MKPSKYGLLFLRPYKAGSTTISGIVMRLAHRRAQRHMFDQKVRLQHPVSPRKTLFPASLPSDETSSSPKLFCDHRTNHGSAVSYQYALRDKGRSFLLSIIRNPTRRAISYFFYFGVTADGKEPTDANFRNYLHEKMSPNLFLEDLSVYPISGTDVRDLNYKGVVQDVLDEYDFIAILERFDESLVALKMILSLDFEDILYVRDRSEGSFSNGDQNRPCVYLLPRLVPLSPRIIWKLMPHRLFIISFCRISFLTPGMKEFFTSETWNEHIKGDILLYQAVHNSLDLTIDRLGRDEFQRQLAVFLKVNQRAQKKCAPRAIGMCSDGGDPIPIANRTCYIWSEGCSHACLDEIHTQDEFEVWSMYGNSYRDRYLDFFWGRRQAVESRLDCYWEKTKYSFLTLLVRRWNRASQESWRGIKIEHQQLDKVCWLSGATEMKNAVGCLAFFNAKQRKLRADGDSKQRRSESKQQNQEVKLNLIFYAA